MTTTFHVSHSKARENAHAQTCVCAYHRKWPMKNDGKAGGRNDDIGEMVGKAGGVVEKVMEEMDK